VIKFLQCDLSDPIDVATIFSRANDVLSFYESENAVSCLVNCAATSARGNLFSTTVKEFDQQFALNVRAPFLLSRDMATNWIQYQEKQKTFPTINGKLKNPSLPHYSSGSIVNICSCAAYGGAPFVMAYSASKAALVALTKNNAAELAPHHNTTNRYRMD
jgi:NAD(P)-dependent dehydrogenase (short-subunit alcohol dehydrogenase family)